MKKINLSRVVGVFNVRNLTVRSSLLLCGVLVVVANLVTVAAYLYSGTIERSAIETANRVGEIRNSVEGLRASVLEARRREQEYLRTKYPEAVEHYQAAIDAVLEATGNLVLLAEGNGKLIEQLGEVELAVINYMEGMEGVAALQDEMGVFQDEGLRGALAEASANLEYDINASGEPRLSILFRQALTSEQAYMSENNPAFLSAFDNANQQLKMNLGTAGLDGDTRAALDSSIDAYADALHVLADKNDQLYEKMTEMIEFADSVDPILEAMRGETRAIEDREASIAASDRALARTIVIGVLIIAAIVLVGAFLLITRRVAPPLAQAARYCADIADGNLTRDIQTGRRDEIGNLLSSLAEMNSKLRRIVGDVRSRASSINSGAQEIATGNTDLSQRTEEQAASLEETASSMDEMTSTVRQNADNARQANQLANAAREQAERGGNVVSGAVTAMGEINTASKKIADIIGVVDEIAFQTNLLALNAAVEAARAGEQGRGFAVVATEVRNLAQRSAAAAREIKDLIQDSVNKVEAGSKLVDESGATLSEIVVSIKKVSDIVSEIAAASTEQSDGIDQVNKAVMQMDEMTQQNAALVEQAAAGAKSLEEQAVKLAQRVAYFRVSAEDAVHDEAEDDTEEVSLRDRGPQRSAPAPRQPAAPAPSRSAAPKSLPATPPPRPVNDDMDWEEF